ncbi:MAG: hypothetical protein JWM57_2345 [Phycisphaerales bacterium]|nr:hypothetical protein [Phycisphaerales bacterium]
MVHRGWLGGIVAVLAAVAAAQASEVGGDLRSGPFSLSISAGQPVRVMRASAAIATTTAPLMADLIDATGQISRLSGTYAKVDRTDGGYRASGVLETAAGSILEFADEFTAVTDGGSFRLDRTVTVRHAANADKGFRTQFSAQLAGAKSLADVQVFVPGMWYCDAAHVPPSGLIGDPSQQNYLIREDRLPLPLAMIRNRSDGLAVTVIHTQPDGTTFAAEDTRATVIDDRMQFASLGPVQQDGTAVALAYPGAEKDQSRIAGKPGPPAAERFHPVREGLSQHWQMVLHVAATPSFDDAMRDAWQTAYDAFAPKPVALPMPKVYAASIDVLDHYFLERNGIPGFPFAVTLPDGKVRDVSFQMGFVGEQIPCAAHLIAAGFKRPQAALVKKGERIVDFWAANCLTPTGLPRTWYDVDPKPHWRDYKTFTRIATDGMQGMLQAWRRMKLNGRDKPAWLACCRKYGDWLVAHQNADGSYFRQYADDAKPLIDSKSATLHPVRFLIDLFNATGDNRYLAAAKRAGKFGQTDIGDNANYYGGTADNNDVKDKEAGWIALDSFLALYEVTADRAWLIPATHAATFTETWVYGWNVPIDRTGSKVTIPKIQTTAGMSLIATGHSGSDVYLAFAPFAYFRLSIYSGDAHFAAMAKLLMQNTRQLVDVDGSLGYAQPGLLTEAFSLAPPRGHGVNVWLPWCTAAVLDPMQQFQDAFGAMELDQIDQLPQARRTELLTTYSRRHGFPALRSKP